MLCHEAAVVSYPPQPEERRWHAERFMLVNRLDVYEAAFTPKSAGDHDAVRAGLRYQLAKPVELHAVHPAAPELLHAIDGAVLHIDYDTCTITRLPLPAVGVGCWRVFGATSAFAFLAPPQASHLASLLN